jgi:23S rRNA pseudouridine2605 synthase
MCDAIGHPVQRLVRVRIGPLRDPNLGPGAWRELTTSEVKSLIESVAASGAQLR